MEIRATGTRFPLFWEIAMKTFATLLLAASFVTSAVACDKVDAAKVQFALSEMGAQWSEQGGRAMLEWGWAWDGTGRAQRLELLRAFAGSDSCLTGRAREIAFYRKGQLVGMALPATGVQLVGETATAQASTRSGPSAQRPGDCAN
jgi:hypothetical protein